MVLFEVKGWDLKNNNKIKVGGLPEKKNKNKNKNKNKREPKQIDNGSNITNNETNAKPSKIIQIQKRIKRENMKMKNNSQPKININCLTNNQRSKRKPIGRTQMK